MICCLLCYSLCSLFAVLPCSLPSQWYPAYSASLRQLRHPMFDFVLLCDLLFVLLCVLFFGLPSLPSLGSLVSSLPHHLDIEMLFLFFVLQLCVSAFFFSFHISFSCLVFRLVLSCRPSVGRSPGHIIELIVPANSNFVSSGLGLRPECMLILVSFFSFPFCLFPFFALLSSFSDALYECTTAMFLVLSRCN